jgi:hypothetical protein
MPFAVFFNGGIATHGTTAVGMLGRPASHGCIRLTTGNAQIFFNIVHRYGFAATRINVRGSTAGDAIARRHDRNDPRYAARPAPKAAVRIAAAPHRAVPAGKAPTQQKLAANRPVMTGTPASGLGRGGVKPRIGQSAQPVVHRTSYRTSNAGW